MKKSLKFCKSKTGFTLVELVIVIAIVIILSVVSVPIYRGYIDKAKMSEAYALWGAVLAAQKAYYGEYGNFYLEKQTDLNETAYSSVLGVDARGNKYFSWFRIGSDFRATDSSAKSGFSFNIYNDPGKPSGTVRKVLNFNFNLTSGINFAETTNS